jgi:hypothetical protein
MRFWPRFNLHAGAFRSLSGKKKHMGMSLRQVIVLGLSLVAFVGGVGGLVYVSQNPPPPPERKKLPTSHLGNRYSEPELERRRLSVPKTTDSPPLAGEEDLETADIFKSKEKDAVPAEKMAASQKNADQSKTPENDESAAAKKLKEAKTYLAEKKIDKAKECIQEIMEKYLSTKAAEEAINLSNDLK